MNQVRPDWQKFQQFLVVLLKVKAGKN